MGSPYAMLSWNSAPVLAGGVLLSTIIIALLSTALVKWLGRRKPARPDSALMEGVQDGFLILDQERRVAGYNSRMKSMLPGQNAGPEDGMDVRHLYEQLCQDSTQALNKLDNWLGNLSGDSTANLELTTSNEQLLLITEKSVHGGAVASTVRDISEKRHSARQLDRAREFDALTGLANRSRFMTKLREAVRLQQSEFALLICDLRDFRQINDSYGQYFADQLLVEIACKLKEAMPADAIAARIDGDEFGVLVPHVRDREALFTRASNFLGEIGNGIGVAARTLPVRASMGMAFSPQDGNSVGELKSAADSAVARAKAVGTNTLATYDRPWQQAADRAHQIDIGLEKALQREEFSRQYQPQIDVKTNLTSGMEALLRWHSASLGTVSPAEFIPRAERSDLINNIGEWVLRKSIADYRKLAQFGTSPAMLSINLSRRQFADGARIQRLADIIESADIDASLLTLEITETALLSDSRQARELLFTLKQLGVKLSIDDFGVGYSSFAELRDFPIDEVKIDRTFVQNIENSSENRQIIKATVDVARSLGAEVVAEGIETAQQLQLVRELGCDRAQGFYLCEPMQATTIPDVCLGNTDPGDSLEATIFIHG